MLSLLSLTPHSPHILSRGLAFPTTAVLQRHVLTCSAGKVVPTYSCHLCGTLPGGRKRRAFRAAVEPGDDGKIAYHTVGIDRLACDGVGKPYFPPRPRPSLLNGNKFVRLKCEGCNLEYNADEFGRHNDQRSYGTADRPRGLTCYQQKRIGLSEDSPEAKKLVAGFTEYMERTLGPEIERLGRELLEQRRAAKLQKEQASG